MDREKLDIINKLNRAIIKFRGMYSQWSNIHGISYHEMLVYYTIREYGFCTQKLICDSYLLPKQTINNVFVVLRKEGILSQYTNRGESREKIFVLTEKREKKYLQFMSKLDKSETLAFDSMGKENMSKLKNLFLEYDKSLSIALNGAEEKNGNR